MNFKNKKSLLLVILLSLQSVQVRASESAQETPESFSISKIVVGFSALALLVFFVGFKYERSARKKMREYNKMPYEISIPDNIHTINIKSSPLSSMSVCIKGKKNHDNKVRASNGNWTYESPPRDGILTINNDSAGNVFNIPSTKMVSASTVCGNIIVDNVNSVLAKIYGAGDICLYDIKSGIFGHTSCGNIYVIDSYVHNNMRTVNTSTLVGNTYFKIYTQNQKRQEYSTILRPQTFGLMHTNLVGSVVIGVGRLIIEEV